MAEKESCSGMIVELCKLIIGLVLFGFIVYLIFNFVFCNNSSKKEENTIDNKIITTENSKTEEELNKELEDLILQKNSTTYPLPQRDQIIVYTLLNNYIVTYSSFEQEISESKNIRKIIEVGLNKSLKMMRKFDEGIVLLNNFEKNLEVNDKQAIEILRNASKEYEEKLNFGLSKDQIEYQNLEAYITSEAALGFFDAWDLYENGSNEEVKVLKEAPYFYMTNYSLQQETYQNFINKFKEDTDTLKFITDKTEYKKILFDKIENSILNFYYFESNISNKYYIPKDFFIK